jgi:hypothetical protein
MRACSWISRVAALGTAAALAAGCAGTTIDNSSPVAAAPSPRVGSAAFIPAASVPGRDWVPLPNDLPTPPGRYVLSADAQFGIPPLEITFELTQDGWESWGPGVVTIERDVRDEVGLGFANVTDLYADPCKWDRLGVTEPPVGPSVDQLIAGLREVPHVRASDPIDTRLGGVAGRYVELTVDPDQDFSTCDRGEFHIWVESRGNSRYYQGPGQIEQFWVLDAYGVRLVVEGSFFPEASSKSRADLREIVESIRIKG